MFKDRKDAGMQLAERLKEYIGQEDMFVLASPRGGVLTSVEIANRLKASIRVKLQ